MTSGRPADGFTLLEVLVALAILSLSLAAIYQAFGIGLRNDAQTHRYWAATILAESRLALIGTEVAADVGRWTGERSEEHTSELQSLMRISYAVFCLKKKKK